MLDFLSAGFDKLLAMVDTIHPVYLYLMLFGIAFLENIFPPIPGDTFTLVGGYLAATGKLLLVPTFISITLGTISSVMLVYMLGYRGGHEYFYRKNFRFFNKDDLARVDDLFRRFGVLTLLFSRFIVGARVMVAVGAGISKYPPGRMFVLSYISGALFHGILIGLAYLLYAYIDNIVEGFNIYSKIVLVIFGALVILWLIIIVRRLKDGRKKA